jgi:predicted outer membrane lipoprotein
VTRRSLRIACTAAAAALAAVALLPPVAGAHGLVGRADLPIPTWLFGWAAAIVLAASFAALAALWREPRLQEPRERRLVRIPRVVDALCGALGIAYFAVVVYAGFEGTGIATANIADTSVYVIFWVGLVVASLVFGDVFRAFNPWRSVAVAVAWAARPLTRRRPWRTRPYPERLGRWPAVIGIAAFAWVELVYVNKTDPSKLALLALAYAAVQLVGMAVYGIEQWSRRGDAFGVYFNLFSRLSVWDRRDGVLHLRPLLGGAPRWEVVPGSVALLCVAIGSTTFDGFSNGPAWASISPSLQSFFSDLGAGQQLALELAGTVGLAGAIAVITTFYRLGIRGMQTVGGGRSSRELAGLFAHSLIPIAFAYAVAHYFSLLVYQSQAMGYLVSDPLGDGSNLFGTAGNGIDYNVISGAGIWYVQVGALVCGHVAGLVLAHDRALATYPDTREATRSQYWMLVVMVGFTSLGLWLLSAVNR